MVVCIIRTLGRLKVEIKLNYEQDRFGAGKDRYDIVWICCEYSERNGMRYIRALLCTM